MFNDKQGGCRRFSLGTGLGFATLALACVPTRVVQVAIFALTSLLASVVSASQPQLGDPKSMRGLELRAIPASVLGGVSLTGGVGSTGHVYVVTGAILLAAMMLGRLKARGTR